MLTQRTMDFGTCIAAAGAVLSVGVLEASAEPPACYAGRPAVLPAPMTYGAAYGASDTRITYADPSARRIYQRTYSAPAQEYDSARVVYATRRPALDIPVVVDTSYDARAYGTVYYTPRRVTYLPVPYTYGHHRPSSYYGGHHSPRSHYRAGLRFSRHGGFGRHQGHHHRSGGHRRLGVSLSFGGSHHGRHGGFSFSYGR